MSAAAPPPLLFVHGAFAGAWCWEAGWAPHLRERGWQVECVDLPGRIGMPDHDRLQAYGLADFIDAVRAAVDRFERPPVVIGHSMGGCLAMHVGAIRRLAGLVLIASVPPTGLASASATLAWRDPELWHEVGRLQSLGEEGANYHVLKRAMFSEDVPEAAVQPYLGKFQNESRQVVAALQPPQTINPYAFWGLPVKVLGGSRDLLIPPIFHHWTAGLLGRTAEVLDGLGHGLMLEPGWELAVARFARWLESTYGTEAARAA